MASAAAERSVAVIFQPAPLPGQGQGNGARAGAKIGDRCALAAAQGQTALDDQFGLRPRHQNRRGNLQVQRPELAAAR